MSGKGLAPFYAILATFSLSCRDGSGGRDGVEADGEVEAAGQEVGGKGAEGDILAVFETGDARLGHAEAAGNLHLVQSGGPFGFHHGEVEGVLAADGGFVFGKAGNFPEFRKTSGAFAGEILGKRTGLPVIKGAAAAAGRWRGLVTGETGHEGIGAGLAFGPELGFRLGHHSTPLLILRALRISESGVFRVFLTNPESTQMPFSST